MGNLSFIAAWLQMMAIILDYMERTGETDLGVLRHATTVLTIGMGEDE